MIERYPWAGGEEAMIRFGPADGPVVILALPLFEEANRTRTFAVGLLRALGKRGIAGALPDLPGTGESLTSLSEVTLLIMREAFEGVAEHFQRLGRQAFAVGMRSGALLDTLALVPARWHLAPMAGEDVLRELVQVKNADGANSYDMQTIVGAEDFVEIAGNLLSAEMLADLSACSPMDGARIVRLDSDPRPADVKLPGSPLWRRAELGDDPALAELLADDIAAWVRQCAA